MMDRRERIACGMLVACVGMGLLIACAIPLWYLSPRNGCQAWGWPQCEFPRDFAAQVLLLDESVFRSGTTAGPIKTGLMRNAQEHFFRSFYWGDYHANHEVWRYATLKQADSKFDEELGNTFRSDLTGVPYVTLPHRSPTADRFDAACAATSDFEGCGALARYDEYIVRFEARMSPVFMSRADFENILKVIDERMARYLGKRVPTPTVLP